jgi:histidyl-tRNA synthetase
MGQAKPRTMPGVLELKPLEQIAFQGMLDVIRGAFERYGFLPVETPAIEYTDLLLTKSGGETERQVYFVQSTGSRKQGDDPELALRFDLTVPLARYVAEHERELTFPFRRYQMQRVYRGESAQRGRFREFYQCDIDVIGKDQLSIRFDAELPAVIHAIFRELKVGPFQVQLNHRMLLRGYFEGLGLADPEQQMLVLREVDKLDKRGAAEVRKTLAAEPFLLNAATIESIFKLVDVRSSSHADALSQLAALESHGELFERGRSELVEVLELIRAYGVPESHYAINLSIARGLDYYTGIVFETILTEHPQIGSVCSGGRYENLASHYTRSKLPGVGISIGATRLYWQLREAGLIGLKDSTVKVLVTQLDETELHRYLKLGADLRAAGINTEVQLESRKLAKQLQYADRAGIRFALMLGAEEISRNVIQVKDLRKQDQFEVALPELIETLKVELAQAEAMGAC